MPLARKILIVDDHGIIRDGLRALLSAERDVRVVGAVADGREAIRAAGELTPDLIVMDIAMPVIDGPAAIARIKRRQPQVRILVLTFHSDEPHIFAALNAGVDAYVMKGDSKQELLGAIRLVLAGRKYLSPAICDHVIKGYLGTMGGHDAEVRLGLLDVLSSREREVLKMIAEGLRTREIAKALSLSPKTVEKHRGNLMRKLNLRSAAAAAAFAMANGLVRP